MEINYYLSNISELVFDNITNRIRNTKIEYD